MFDFSIITSWVHGLLTADASGWPFSSNAIVGGCLLLMYTVIAIPMIFMERKVCAALPMPPRADARGSGVRCRSSAMSSRCSPSEIITIRRSDKFLYNLAPYIVILASVLAFACLPVNKGLEVLDFNVGIFL